MVRSLCKELVLQKTYLAPDLVQTIYLGGGTPSLLGTRELHAIFEVINTHFTIADTPEITLEANPDDLTVEKLKTFYKIGINRLSIGVQSFNDEFLAYLNRPHSGTEAKNCIANAREQGIDNISIDLIYGIPSEDHSVWQSDIHQAIHLAPNHISSYCLTIEPKTVFGNWVQKGRISDVDDDFAAGQYEYMVNALGENGYEQYEVSNFCRNGYYAVHNSSYWKNEKYLGIGPGAHSFNKTSRQYNIAHNQKYLRALEKDQIPFEKEVLTPEQKVNEYIMTGLRTKWGCDLEWIRQQYGYDILKNFNTYLKDLSENGMARLEKKQLVLTSKGRLFADKIAGDLFI